ncbi:MAG: ROK family protein, partial [Bacilli bacterium]|nr:ROK family protein [Bacilli bacterium]
MTELQKNIIAIIQDLGKCSRKALTNILNVTAAAITQNTKLLIDAGYLRFLYEVDAQKVGRKEEMLAIIDDCFFSLGIDIDDEEINVISLNANRNVTSENSFNDIDEVISFVDNIDVKTCIGVVISKKGFYDLSLLSNKEKELIQIFEKNTIDVHFLNNIASLAYAYKFKNKENQSFLLIKYGPGVGSACFINNNLITSKNQSSFEIGKMLLGLNGETLENKIRYQSI